MIPLVELRTAPEPSEVIWENLELSDEHEQKMEKISYAVVSAEILVGLMAIVLVKRWIATSSLEHLDKHDESSPVWDALEGCAVHATVEVTVEMTLGVAVGVTLGVAVGVTLGVAVGVTVDVAVRVAMDATVGVAVDAAVEVTDVQRPRGAPSPPPALPAVSWVASRCHVPTPRPPHLHPLAAQASSCLRPRYIPLHTVACRYMPLPTVPGCSASSSRRPRPSSRFASTFCYGRP